MTDAIDIIHRDHVNMNRVLATMVHLVDGLGQADSPGADLALLNSIVYYIRLYPDRCHHPKEEKYLFKALARRSADAADLIAELERQHAEGAKRIDAVAAALTAFDKEREDPAALRAAAHAYADFQRKHMDLEESRLLPLARRLLPRDDWGGIAEAFAGDADPMFSANMETGFQALYEHITRSYDTTRPMA